MSQIITTAMQILAYLIANKDTIRQLVINIEGLIPDAPGQAKAQAVKTFIAAGLGIEAQVEQSWPLVSPVFNLFVGIVKAPAKA